jgi:hypothetical protein
MLVHMPQVITTKILFFFLLLSIHFYEKGGNVELELTTQIIFPLLIVYEPITDE